MRVLSRFVGLALLASAGAWGAAVPLPGGTVTVDSLSTTGTSFTYSGTLSPTDTITFSVSGQPCLQNAGTLFCTNPAGVLRVNGNTGGQIVGSSFPFTGNGSPIPGNNYAYGSLIMIIQGVGAVQVFPTNSANDLGSSNPPATLTVPTTTLSALGFGNFTPQSNPQITFILGDTGYTDNGGNFVITQGAPPVGTPISNSALIGTAAALCLLGIYQMTSRLSHQAR